MDPFDVSILHFLNGLSQKSMFFDSLMNFLVSDYFVKGGIIMAVLWFLWFHQCAKSDENRTGVVRTLISCFIAIIVGRALELTLPFRQRPVYNPNLTFLKPFKFANYGLDNWSSFPSDHAVMFFALATGIFLVSKKAGIFTYLYVVLVICVPRMYLGFHYPTDILAGAAVGILITLLVSMNKTFVPLTRRTLQFSANRPGLFHALFFLLSFQISTMFEETRTVGIYLYNFLSQVI